MHTGTVPCLLSHHPRNSVRIHMRARARLSAPSSTTRVIPSKPCCTAPLPSTSRRGWSWQARVSSTAKATTTRRRSTWSKPFEVNATSAAPNIIFHPASGIGAGAVAQAQDCLRKRILRAFVRCDLIEKADAKEMLAYQHSGFSLDAGVCTEEHDRAGASTKFSRCCARYVVAKCA